MSRVLFEGVSNFNILVSAYVIFFLFLRLQMPRPKKRACIAKMLCALRCARRELEAAELPVKLSQTGLSDCMKLKEN